MKKVVVEAKFKQKDGMYKVTVKALRNGTHLIKKDKFQHENKKEVFDFVSNFITAYEATNIYTSRGLIEDSFAKYLTDIQTGSFPDEEQMIEGVIVELVPERHRDTLADLKTYKWCLDETIRHEDYEGLIFQGILYNNARDELFEATQFKANAFEATVTVPLKDMSKLHSAVVSINEVQLRLGKPTFKVQKFNRVSYIESQDYKLTVNFE